MASIKILIVDDEPRSRDVIRKHSLKLGNIELVGECSNPIEAAEALRENSIDLVFLDIEMPYMTGLQFLGTLSDPPSVILVTAHKEFALEGYELNVVDYLLKPVTFARFLRAMNKFHQLERAGNLSFKTGEIDSDGDHILLLENHKVHRISLKDICFVEETKGRICVQLDKKQVLAEGNLADLLDRLPSGQFLRIHNSCLVSVSRIEAFTSTTVELENATLPIGRAYKKSVLAALDYRM